MDEHEVTRREFACAAAAAGIGLVFRESTEPRDEFTIVADNHRIAVSSFETGTSGA